jgi:hypothetical protein
MCCAMGDVGEHPVLAVESGFESAMSPLRSQDWNTMC